MNSVMSQLPKVSYIKLIDVWMTGCIAFVFAAFIEFVLVNQLANRETHAKEYSQVWLDFVCFECSNPVLMLQLFGTKSKLVLFLNQVILRPIMINFLKD